MKSTLQFVIFSCALALPVLGQAPAAPADPFETGMREAFNAYKKGDNDAVSAKLKELLSIIEEKGASKLGGYLPDMLGTWKGEAVKRESDGSISMSRTYISGDQKATIKIVKDYPQLAELLPIFMNEAMLEAAGRKMHKISGQTAVMEGENKLEVIVDERIYISLEGEGGAGENELVALANKLDLPEISKIK